MDMNTAVQIVEKVGGTYKLNSDALKRILLQKSVLNKKVAVLTVAGAFRKGKSFLLSNIVRYLQCERDGSDWMDPDASVTGFTWKRSTDSVTEGILMWPEPFLAKDSNGEEYAILLMDTEGAFDHKSSMNQCATVFALAALLSSVLVYNVMQDVQEDTLNHLQFFASYGSYALDEEDTNSPFQSLLFLIRDWQNDDDFGFEAGRRLLDEKFKFHASTSPSMRTLRKDIQRSFIDMKCSLLPSPGNKICRGSEGTITVDDMDEEFREELAELVPKMFNDLMSPKEVAGKRITGAEFLALFDTYVKIFASGKVPEPKSIFDATSEATHQSALNTSLDNYSKTMKSNFSQLTDRQYFEDSKLRTIHQEATNAALKIFADTRKMGNLPRFVDSLKQKIEDQYNESFLKDNQNRMRVEKARKEKEETEKRRIEQEQRAKEERARYEREQERLRLQMEKEKKEKEEAERKRVEERRRYEERMERERRERQEEQRREREERERERERMEQKMREQAERERRAREEEAEKLRKQMEQMRLDNERREREREAEAERQLQRERQRRAEAEQEAREAAQRAQMQSYMMSSYGSPMMSNFGGSNYGGSSSDCFSPSYSNASRAGTPSGRSPGRPRGSVMERYNQGIMPREGTRDYARLQRDGFL